MRVAAILLVTCVGCTDDANCIGGVCPNYGEARSLSGPCRSAAIQTMSATSDEQSTKFAYTFEYDAAGELARVASDTHGWTGDSLGGFKPVETMSETLWSYDPSGAVDAVDVNTILADMTTQPSASWRFDNQHVTAMQAYGPAYDRIFDRTLFSFLPAPGSERASPDAELGLLSAGQSTFRWVVISPTLWSRYSTVDNSQVAFQLDDRGRILGWSWADGVGVQTFSYSYDGDLLVHRTDYQGATHTYLYDKGENIVEHSTDAGYREVYDYGCWK